MSERLALNNEISTQGWQVAVPIASVRESERNGRIGTYYRYDVDIGMTRDWRNYAWKLGIPLILIVLMAYTVYFIPTASVAQQVGVGMTSMHSTTVARENVRAKLRILRKPAGISWLLLDDLTL